MADTVTLEVQGLSTIDAALRDLPVEVQREVMGAALRVGAEVLKLGIANRIHDRTGRTARDLRIEVQVQQDDVGGAAAVGAGPKRTHILRFLEGGTKPHVEPKKQKRLSRSERAQGKTPQSINAAKGPMAFGGRVYSRVEHPGTRAQAPMRIAIAVEGPKAVTAFGQRAWEGIRAAAERLGKR